MQIVYYILSISFRYATHLSSNHLSKSQVYLLNIYISAYGHNIGYKRISFLFCQSSFCIYVDVTIVKHQLGKTIRHFKYSEWCYSWLLLLPSKGYIEIAFHTHTHTHTIKHICSTTSYKSTKISIFLNTFFYKHYSV